MSSYSDDLLAAEQFITEQGPRPALGVVLGSGLGQFVDHLSEAAVIDYQQIPGMPSATVSGHAGCFWLGKVNGTNIACLEGRVHAYEGRTATEVVYGVRLLARLGVKAVLLTNAAGGFGKGFFPGDPMLITDHLNLTGLNPLVGPLAGAETAFCDMTRAYDPGLRRLAETAAEELGLVLRQGVYAGVLGPSYETPAEIQMLRALGAHAVGMSTVLETIALRQLGVQVGAISLITNLAAGISESLLSHDEVKATAANSQQDFTALMHRWCELILRRSGAEGADPPGQGPAV